MRIAVINESLTLPQATLAHWLAACEYQIKKQFAPNWALTAELRLVPHKKVADPQEFRVVVVDKPEDVADNGYYGYHELDEEGKPMAYVFLESIIADQRIPSVVLSHELLEMIADPFTWATALTPGRKFQAVSVEMCDPVQGSSYFVDGVEVSNFVLPNYFVPGSYRPYDYLNLLKRPLSVARGGYLLIWYSKGGWGEKSHHGAVAASKHAFSRSRQILKSGKKPQRVRQ